MAFPTAAMLLAVAAIAGETGIVTPPAPSKPQIHGAKVHGVRPGHPLLYRIPATGVRPMHFSAKGLPAGLKLDPDTGIITGVVEKRGEYPVELQARNSQGTAKRAWKIVAGDQIALTPPMGWSTWYMAYTKISDRLVRDQADAMVSKGLADHGYAYIDIDDGWNMKPNSTDPVLGGPARDASGNLLANRNFPDMKAMTDYVHSKGLKAGIYIGPGPTTCAGFEASYGHEEADARQFARWGFDLLKYDLCSYGKMIKDRKNVEEEKKPYALMGGILKNLDRDMVFNLCQYGLANVWEWGREVGGNFWRTAGDVGHAKEGSLWKSMSAYGFGQAGMEKWAGPGGWNDPDNILIGRIMWNKELAPTPLTHDEQYTWVTLWSLMASPLVIGGDLTTLDDFTLSLLTNDEVIDVDQDVSGKQAAPVSRSGELEVWAKDLADESKAVGLFNRGEEDSEITVRWADLGITGKQMVRDLWRQKNLGKYSGEFRMKVNCHGAAMLTIHH